jgi:hypothetical protein
MYCPHHSDAKTWGERGDFEEDPAKFDEDGHEKSKYAYLFGDCKDEATFMANTGFIQHPNTTDVIIHATPPNGDPGRAFIACGDCGGDLTGEEEKEQCFFAQNSMPGMLQDTSLFTNPNGQCFSTFQLVPYYAAYPPSALFKRLLWYPAMIRMNLVAILEAYIITNLKRPADQIDGTLCQAYKDALDQWFYSFQKILNAFKHAPTDNPAVTREVLLTLIGYANDLSMTTDCTNAGDTLMKLTRANAVALDLNLNVTDMRAIDGVDQLLDDIEAFTSPF